MVNQNGMILLDGPQGGSITFKGLPEAKPRAAKPGGTSQNLRDFIMTSWEFVMISTGIL